MSLRRRSIAALASLLAAAALAGCGLGAGSAPSGVSMTVTEDFGAKNVLSLSRPEVDGSETAMRLLMRNAKVSTEYSGGFVSSIDGHAEAHSKPFDWFYYVNGEEAGKGAADTNVHSGDHIWWDLHDWSESDHIPAVVGSFPAPFSTGLGGKRLPILLECAVPNSPACRAVSHKFDSLGIVAGFAAVGTVAEVTEEDSLKVLIGTWAQLMRTATAQTILKGPATGGVYVRVLNGGSELELLNKEGVPAQRLGAGAGLIAATRYSDSSPEWIVTGTSPAGVMAAAAHFDAASLDGHFAIAVAPSGGTGSVIALPDAGG
jgi:Domain of unknown function (DUF4430)